MYKLKKIEVVIGILGLIVACIGLIPPFITLICQILKGTPPKLTRGEPTLTITPSEIIQQATQTTDLITDETATPISITVEQFIRDYFGLLNQHSFKNAYSKLDDEFQNNHPYSEYLSFWDSVDHIELNLIDVKSESDSQALVYVEIDYHYKSGKVTKGHTIYKLLKMGDSWLFTPNN